MAFTFLLQIQDFCFEFTFFASNSRFLLRIQDFCFEFKILLQIKKKKFLANYVRVFFLDHKADDIFCFNQLKIDELIQDQSSIFYIFNIQKKVISCVFLKMIFKSLHFWNNIAYNVFFSKLLMQFMKFRPI